MIITRLWLILLLTLLCCFSSEAQRPFVQDVWLNENRTALKANVLLQDKQGYILVGSAQGLFRYNGSNFKLIRSTEKAQVTVLVEQQGRIWVGYSNGRLGYLAGDSVAHVSFPGYKPSAAVNAVCVQQDGTTWLGTEAGIVRAGRGAVKVYHTDNGLSDDFIYSLEITGAAQLLAGTDQGINRIRLDNDKITVSAFSSDNGLQDNIARVVRRSGAPGKYWVGAQEGGLSLYDSKTNTCSRIKIAGNWQWGQVNDILPVSAHKMWVATEEGYLLEVITLGTDSARVNAYANPDKRIYSLLLDKSGNIWCATNKGISLVTAEFLRYISLPQPYTLSAVTAMCCDQSNTLWLALSDDVYSLNLNDDIKILRKVYHAPVPVSELYCSPGGRIWMGTSGDGLWLKQNGSDIFRKVNAEGQEHENILSITSSGANLWVAGLNGVKEFRLEGENLRLLKTHNKSSGVGSDYIYQLFADNRGRMWMATDGAGVCMYDEKQYYHWNTFSTPNNTVAYTLTQDAQGALWAGTLYKDLFRYANGRWENIRRKEIQDIDVNLSSVDANATGQVIAVYQRCIDLWYPNSKFFRHFNSRHGMGMDSTSRVLNCSARDTAGHVLLPFEKGLLLFCNQDKVYDIRPDIYIQRISNNLRNINTGQHDFGPDENYLSFYFDGISFTNPERLNYRFRLEGYSDNWVYTNESLATFPKLPPGTFTFKVQVSLNGGFETASETSYTFTIAAPVWRRPWFIALATVVAAGIAYGLIKFRDRRMQRLAQLEQERVLFDYEHLKSQVNPHFLFNSLNTLTNLIEEDQESAVAYTERLSDLYRNMLTYHNKDLILLSEEWDILTAYLYIQQSRFGNALQINSDIPQQLKERKMIPPMALQLLVENAIKHNIVSMTSPLVIDIAAREQEIVVTNRITPKVRKGQESGIGLANIRNRYALLTRKKVYFGKEGENWVVKLPLL